jgi:hypothetical protein
MAKRRGFIKYKSYLFIDKDPVIDALRGEISIQKIKLKQIADNGGPTYSTLHNWFSGNTRRPQFATVMATVRTLGKKGVTTNGRGTPYLVD